VVFSAGAGGGDPARTYAVDRDAAIRVIDAAGQAGVRRFVMVSYFGAGPDHGVAQDNSFFRMPRRKQRPMLTCGPANWTGPCSGPAVSRWNRRPAGSPSAPYAADKAEVSREDVALVAAAALNDDSTIRRTIDFNNGDLPIPEALATSGLIASAAKPEHRVICTTPQLVCRLRQRDGVGIERSMLDVLREREPGGSPGLSRSGMQERPPSRSTDRKIGKRRPLGAPPWCVPASPKTCQLCRARRAWRLTASWNGRLAVTVAVVTCVLHRFGYASVGGDHPVN
jgi:hypothetical protein